MRVIVRIRAVSAGRPRNRRLAQAAAGLVLPMALFCSFVCAWRWSYDLTWTGDFLVHEGILSHWQIWFMAAGLLHIVAIQLARYAGQRKENPPDTAVSQRPSVVSKSRS